MLETWSDKSHKMNLTRVCSMELWHWPCSPKPHSQGGRAVNQQGYGGTPRHTHTLRHTPLPPLYLDYGWGLDAAGEEEDGVTQLQQSAASAKRWIQHEGQHDRGERWSHRTEDRWYHSGERQGQFIAGSLCSSFFNTSPVVTIKCFYISYVSHQHFLQVTSASEYVSMVWTWPTFNQPALLF